MFALFLDSHADGVTPDFLYRLSVSSCYLSFTQWLILFSELGTAYVSATTGAVATALGLNALTKVL